MKRTFLILGFLLLLTPIYSQDKITKLTYEIVDTSICPTEQAGQIYTWITQNIAYDTKQLTNRLKYYSPQHTLNRKKAVCYGYSELFNEMCKVLEIESYIINGNCKGFGYVKGDHFTKSDHTWNIIYSDSSWIIIDPTWGSGSLSYDYDFKEKIKRTFNKGAGIKKRIYFTQDPNQKYFNISPDIICTTHFPIDSKWQLKNYPVSYNAFISDSVSESHFLNFEREIETVRYLDTEEHFFIDATNSTRYNPDNKFDIAYQYFNQAKKINISRKTPLDSVLYKLLISSLDYYDSTMHYLSEYKEIRRNQYKTTSQDNKYNYKFANNSLKRIIKIPTTFNNRFFKEYDKLLRNEKLLDRERQSAYTLKYSIPEEIYFNYDSIYVYDTLSINKINARICSDITRAKNYHDQLVSYRDQIKIAFISGHPQNDSIVKYLEAISNSLRNMQYSIGSMDEYGFIQACHAIKVSYDSYMQIIESKKLIESKLSQDFYRFQIKYTSATGALYSVQRNYERLAKLTGNNKVYSQKVLEVYPELDSIYSIKLETLEYMKQHNDVWKKLLSEQNEILSIFGEKGLSNIYDMQLEYYNYISSNRENRFIIDMKLYDSIHSDIKKHRTLYKTTIRKIKEI